MSPKPGVSEPGGPAAISLKKVYCLLWEHSQDIFFDIPEPGVRRDQRHLMGPPLRHPVFGTFSGTLPRHFGPERQGLVRLFGSCQSQPQTQANKQRIEFCQQKNLFLGEFFNPQPLHAKTATGFCDNLLHSWDGGICVLLRKSQGFLKISATPREAKPQIFPLENAICSISQWFLRNTLFLQDWGFYKFVFFFGTDRISLR